MEPLPHITAWVELPASWGDPARRFVFGDPIDVWQATKLDEVRPAMERVEIAQRLGLFVVGFLSYESAPAFDPAMSTPPRGDLPYAWFVSFNTALSVSSFILHPEPVLTKEGSFPVSSLPPHPLFLTTKSEYTSAVNQALSHIRAGDIYQVNYTIRAELEVEAPFTLFQTLLAAGPMPHAAYIDMESPPALAGGLGGVSVQIISLSPEMFLRKRGSILESRPMKGTARREPSWAADEAARIALSRDGKNRAENVMIVDLVRNDLGRICKPGSVTAPELWRVDRFPTVHQMTSLVRGELPGNQSLFDIFAALFPPGSVIGAPKIRAMQIISDLESAPRGIYCGTIGLFFPNGDFECNVAIRTIQCGSRRGGLSPRNPPASLGLGSGIVADSDPEVEWRETQLKGHFVTRRPLDFLLYETIRYDQRIKDKGKREKQDASSLNSPSSFLLSPFSFLDLHSHLRRLRQSCIYFGRPFPLTRILEHLRALKSDLGHSPARVKLDLHIIPPRFSGGARGGALAEDEGGQIETHVIRENLTWPEEGMTVMLSALRLDPSDFRLYHKTNLRPEKYAELEKARTLGAQELLFLNTRGELCEGALSNIILKINGQWLTPALSCGLLPGTWREKQLASGRIREAILTLDDLSRAKEVRMGNAVRGEGKVRSAMDYSGKFAYYYQETSSS